MPQPPYPTRTDGSFGRPKSDDQAATDLDTQLQAVEYNELADWVIQLTEEIGDPDGTDPGSLWEAALAGGAGTGDVVGPAGATDHAIARYSGATGKLIQNSAVLVNDTNDISGARHLTLSGNITLSTGGATVDGIDLTDLRADVDAHTAAANPHSGSVPTSRQVIAGTGLTNGGALTSDVTLNVAATDTTITVAANGIAVNKIVAANIDCTGITDNFVLKATGGATPAWEAETGGAVGTLDAVITTTPDNDVIVPSANPIIFRDNAVAALTPLSITKTGDSATATGLHITVPLTRKAIRITDAGLGHDLTIGQFDIIGGGTNLNLSAGTNTDGSPGTLSLQGPHSTTGSTKAGGVRVLGGNASGATSAGGDVEILGGSHTGSTYGNVYIGGTSSTTAVNEIQHKKGFTILQTADHPVTPLSGKGQLWHRTSDGALVFTNDTGADYNLTPRTVLSMGGRYAGGSVTLGHWYGSAGLAPWSTSNMTTDHGTGTDPTVGVGFVGLTSPFNGAGSKVTFRYTTNGTAVDGEIAFYVFNIQDQSAAITPVKLASVNLGAAKVDSTSEVYIDTISPLAAHTVEPGDFFGLFVKHTTTAATLDISASIVIEVWD